MNPFGSDGPVVVGHRGAPREAAENTPASFAAAAAAGAGWVELDVRCSADGVAMVHHDAWLPSGPAVADSTATALRRLGVWDLAAVLAGLPAGLGVDVEVKNWPSEPDYDDTGEAMVVVLAPLMERPDRPVMTSSFNPDTVLALRSRLPGVPAGLLTSSGMRAAAGVEIAVELGVQVYCPSVDTPDLDAVGVSGAHAAGLAVLVWTVDDPARARQLVAAGADAVCTNDPRGLVGALRER